MFNIDTNSVKTENIKVAVMKVNRNWNKRLYTVVCCSRESTEFKEK